MYVCACLFDCLIVCVGVLSCLFVLVRWLVGRLFVWLFDCLDVLLCSVDLIVCLVACLVVCLCVLCVCLLGCAFDCWFCV